MALKKKERVLTPEEFRAKQKRDYASYWIHSEVQFGANLYPVSESFTRNTTLLFLLDPADFVTERVVEVVNQWNQKFTGLNWSAVLVFQPKYAFVKNPKFFDRFKNQKIFIDQFGELFERFGSSQEPVAVILKNGEFVSSLSLMPDLVEMIVKLENQFHLTLRTDDPGLPLAQIEKFQKFNGPTDQTVIQPDSAIQDGDWNGNAQVLISERNGSTLKIPFRGKILRLIGMTHPNARDEIKVAVTFQEKPLPHNLRNSLYDEDTSGNTFIELNKHDGKYDIIQSPMELNGEVKLTFLNAYGNGALFYGFRITR